MTPVLRRQRLLLRGKNGATQDRKICKDLFEVTHYHLEMADEEKVTAWAAEQGVPGWITLFGMSLDDPHVTTDWLHFKLDLCLPVRRLQE